VRRGPFYVAEVSANHNGQFVRAKEIVLAAASSGASAVKFQTYKPETMTLPREDFQVSKGHALWGGVSLFDLYKTAMTPWEWHQELFDLAKKHGLIPFSSPFDRSAVDFLEEIGCDLYKIASLETGDTDLIRYVSETGKPLVISTGASTLTEIEDALNAALSGSSTDVTLLLCTSSYPADPKDSHVSRMMTLRERFGVPIGLSDHTLGIGVSLGAIALGATVIEKHLTLSRNDGGPDAAFSLEPAEFRSLVEEGNKVFDSLGSANWTMQPSEEESRKLRRSLFIVTEVRRGDVATRDNVKALRPNQGGPIKSLDQILGKKFVADYEPGTAATLDCVE